MCASCAQLTASAPDCYMAGNLLVSLHYERKSTLRGGKMRSWMHREARVLVEYMEGTKGARGKARNWWGTAA